jgi:hypothetical protein
VRVATGGGEGDVGGEGEVAGDLFPDELEGVGGGPHVLAAGGDGVGLRGGVEGEGAGMEDGADVGAAFEEALGAEGEKREGEEKKSVHGLLTFSVQCIGAGSGLVDYGCENGSARSRRGVPAHHV